MNHHRHQLILLLLVAVVAAACGDPFSPIRSPVPLPVRVSLVDFRTGSVQDASGFDLIAGAATRTDQTPEWDFLFFVTEDGDPQFRPRGDILLEGASSGLQRVEQEFDDLTEVPGDEYVREEPVPVEEEAVYAAVSRSRAGGSCRLFGKLRVVGVDLEDGEVTFDFVVNPNCNQRNVVPGTSDGGDSG